MASPSYSHNSAGKTPRLSDSVSENDKDMERQRLVDALHAHCLQHKTRCVLYVVGGAAFTIGWLFGRPGASSWLLEAKVPYGNNSMRELFQGNLPGSFCSQETSIALSQLACQRAQRLSEESVGIVGERIRFIGVGFTGALSSYQAKKGGSRCYLATTLENGATVLYSAKLDSRGRDEEETITSEMVLKAIADILGVPTSLQIPPEVTVVSVTSGTSVGVGSLNDNAISHLLFRASGVEPIPNAAFRGLLFPGSFNPLHEGHLSLAKAALAHFPNEKVCFELSVNNVDKPALGNEEVLRRVSQFKEYGLILTKSPRFYEKAAILPGCTFVIGADTAVRIVDTKYYESEADKMIKLSMIIHLHRCRFLVGGRLDSKTGSFTTCELEVKQALPRSLHEAFIFLSEEDFRVDVSSTELRQKTAINNGAL